MLTTTTNRLHADEAERMFVAGMLQGNEEADEGRAQVCAEDIRQYPIRLVYDAVCKIRDLNKRVGLDTVYLEMKRDGTLVELGDNAGDFLASLHAEIPTAANMVYHASEIRDAADRRYFKQKSAETNRDLNESGEPAEEAIERFEQAMQKRRMARDGDNQDIPISQAAAEGLARIDSILAGNRPTVFAGTGSPRLDRGFGGFSAGQLTILAARPSVGKTAMALRFAEAAYTEGVPVALFSLEMARSELVDRLFASTTRVPLSRIRGIAGRMSDEEADRIVSMWGSRDLSKVPFTINDKPSLTASQIAIRSMRLARRQGVKVVIVDYLQLLEPDNPRDNKNLQVGASCKRLKRLAKEAGVAVVCLAQLNRESVKRTADAEPRLSDLRDSGEIEQDADVVMLLHRLDNNAELPVHQVDLILAKNRNGPTGVFPFDYHRSITRFEERAPTL